MGKLEYEGIAVLIRRRWPEFQAGYFVFPAKEGRATFTKANESDKRLSQNEIYCLERLSDTSTIKLHGELAENEPARVGKSSFSDLLQISKMRAFSYMLFGQSA